MPQRDHPANHSSPDYRPDIDGLRAVSVLAVIAFHYGLGLSSGYVGVDVFFVISGYLITRQVVKDLERGRFTFTGFYVRRARRILPAVTGVVIVCGILGWFVLTPGDYATFARSALYVLIGAGNIFFWGNTGYFDAAAEGMPLLHTWSLGIEEQFYFVWPAALVALCWWARGRARRLVGGLLAIILGSFLANVAVVDGYHLSAFYLPQYRAWELATGGLIAVAARPIARRWLAEAAVAFGLAMILASAALLPAKIAYPGAWALLPVLGAAAVIWPASGATWASRLLTLPPAVWIGKISYSLYLYHWPALVFWRHYSGGEPPTRPVLWILLAVSFACAWASWRFVEQVFRWRRAKPRTVFAVAGVSQAAVAAACGLILLSDGAVRRIPEPVRSMSSIDAMWQWRCPDPDRFAAYGYQVCAFGKNWDHAGAHIAIWGDSHAAHLVPVIEQAIKGRNIAAVHLAGCPAIINGETGPYFRAHARTDWHSMCDGFRRPNSQFLKDHPQVSLVIIVAAWGAFAEDLARGRYDGADPAAGLLAMEAGLDATMADVAAPGRRFAIVSQVPGWETDPIPCVMSQRTPLLRRTRCEQDMSKLDLATFDRHTRSAQDRLISFSAARNIRLILPDQALCGERSCTTIVNGEFIYRDTGHLRRNLQPETLNLLAKKLQIQRVLDGLERQVGHQK